MQIKIKRMQQGQAMVEFIVAGSTVLMALFVLIPMVGKLIDVQFYSQQAARHAAWERTVWFDRDEAPPDTERYRADVAIRSDQYLANTVLERNFSSDDSEFNYVDVFRTSPSSNRSHWNYSSTGQSMFSDSDGARDQLRARDTPSLAYAAIDTFNSGISSAISFIDILGVLGDHFMTIAHGMENFYTPTVNVALNQGAEQVTGMERWVFDSFNGQYEVRSAILADGWNAQGPEHFLDRTDDFVISTILDNRVLNTIFDLAGYVDPQVNDLDFGYVNTDPLPDAEADCTFGFCELD